ncbi:MAG: hypothetical protein JWO06_799 [Bacteroidota bacterium]|nr:hypothetical protein [Bacteroidota bacterium]
MGCFFLCNVQAQAQGQSLQSQGQPHVGAILAVAHDTISQNPDSSTQVNVVDTNAINRLLPVSGQGLLLGTENKTVVNDIEQYNPAKRSVAVFILLMLMLGVLTYLKTSFSKDLEDLLQSVVNQNLSQQIFRTQSREISFSSFLLNLNFVVAFSLYVHFILINYFHVSSLNTFSAILLINILFTFFYLSKIITIKLIGVMFELNDACDEYIFNFTSVCKTLGLALLPALFIFYTAPEKIFNFIFAITIFIVIFLFAMLLWRGLSTAYKLMYSSVYHFFLYVCVVEISPIFLLFKLLTKTIH